MQKEQDAYRAHFTPEETLCCAIAEEYLASSFNLPKSTGFIAWAKKNRPLIYPDGQSKTKKRVVVKRRRRAKEKKKKKKEEKPAGSE